MNILAHSSGCRKYNFSGFSGFRDQKRIQTAGSMLIRQSVCIRQVFISPIFIGHGLLRGPGSGTAGAASPRALPVQLFGTCVSAGSPGSTLRDLRLRGRFRFGHRAGGVPGSFFRQFLDSSFLMSEEQIPGVLFRRTTDLPWSSHHLTHSSKRPPLWSSPRARMSKSICSRASTPTVW